MSIGQANNRVEENVLAIMRNGPQAGVSCELKGEAEERVRRTSEATEASAQDVVADINAVKECIQPVGRTTRQSGAIGYFR